MFRVRLVLCVAALLAATAGAQEEGSRLFQGAPWPQIRKSRIQILLPPAMKEAGVDAWVVICRENDNDPLAVHIGGENAGSTASFLFLLSGEAVHSIAVSPPGEAVALRDVGLHDTVVVIGPGEDVWRLTGALLKSADPARIAVNSSGRPVSDGLSFTQRRNLEEGIGPELSARLVSSDRVVAEWLSVKMPEEVAIMREAARVTDRLQREAYATVVPGTTTDADVAMFLKRSMKELGAEDAWAPDQNPNVNSGLDRGHSHSTRKVIQQGDIIQTDFGIKVFGIWCSDIQRFAYVLRKGEVTAPPEVEARWRNAVQGSRTVLEAMKPGVRGFEVDRAQRLWMQKGGSLPVMWGTGHPVGYWAHDVGPALSGGSPEAEPSGYQLLPLKTGQVFAYDGFFTWAAEVGGVRGTKTISVEEMVVVTGEGAEYLIPPQEELILIPSL